MEVNDTVPISMWRAGGVQSTKCRLDRTLLRGYRNNRCRKFTGGKINSFFLRSYVPGDLSTTPQGAWVPLRCKGLHNDLGLLERNPIGTFWRDFVLVGRSLYNLHVQVL